MSIASRVDGFQQRHRTLGFPLAVIYKFVDDDGMYLVALIAFYGFLSVFPLLLLLTTILGVVLSGHPDLQQRVIESALSEFPVIGSQLGSPRRLSGGTAGVVIGLAFALYGGLGVAQAFQYAMNTMWTVARNSRPDPFRARGRSMVILVLIALAVILSTALSTLEAMDLGFHGLVSTVLAFAGTILINAVLFGAAMLLATARFMRPRHVWVGALTAAIVWQALQTFGVAYVARVVSTASASNGVFAVVLGLIAFLQLAALGIVLSAEVDVVRVRRLHPRSLMTMFVDDNRLTSADKRTYAAKARAERNKGQESIRVAFGGERRLGNQVDGTGAAGVADAAGVAELPDAADAPDAAELPDAPDAAELPDAARAGTRHTVEGEERTG